MGEEGTRTLLGQELVARLHGDQVHALMDLGNVFEPLPLGRKDAIERRHERELLRHLLFQLVERAEVLDEHRQSLVVLLTQPPERDARRLFRLDAELDDGGLAKLFCLRGHRRQNNNNNNNNKKRKKKETGTKQEGKTGAGTRARRTEGRIGSSIQ